MDNFSMRSERNFHNLVVKPNHMHLLDKPNGYASAMVKSSLSHQMRFTVQVLEEELCAAGNPHVLQIKLLGDDSREPSSWEQIAHFGTVLEGAGYTPEGSTGISAKPSHRTVFFRHVIMLTDTPLELSIEIKELARIVTFAHTETSSKNSFGTHSHS